MIDQIAAHRAAGLEPAFAVQYLAQLGSGSEHQQKILKGVLNLLQSRFLFRIGDPDDAEQTTRIAMAVYSTMIRDDPDRRARLRVTPEQILNFPNYFCLASWIANGTRIPCFIGQTYPLPDSATSGQTITSPAGPAGRPLPRATDRPSTTTPRAARRDDASRRDIAEIPTPRVSAVPYDDKDAAKQLGARWDPRRCWYIPAGRTLRRSPLAEPRSPTDTRRHRGHEWTALAHEARHDRAGPAAPTPTEPRSQREVRVDYEPPPEHATEPRRQPRPPDRRTRVPGPDTPVTSTAAPAPDSLRELAFLDRINEIGARRPARRRSQPPTPLRRRLHDPGAA